MKIAILAAMDKELDLIVSLFDSVVEMEYEGIKLHHGNLGKHEVFAAKCGIGKVNSALNAYKTIRAVKPDLIINTGVAGGAGLPVGSLLVAEKVAYYDVWCGPGTEYGAADGFPLELTPSGKVLEIARHALAGISETGLICSGDKFVSTPEEIAFIRSKFPDVCAVDMESASIAQTCVMENVAFAIVRIVSDTPGEGENISQYQNFWTDAPQKTFSAVRTLIENL